VITLYFAPMLPLVANEYGTRGSRLPPGTRAVSWSMPGRLTLSLAARPRPPRVRAKIDSASIATFRRKRYLPFAGDQLSRR